MMADFGGSDQPETAVNQYNMKKFFLIFALSVGVWTAGYGQTTNFAQRDTVPVRVGMPGTEGSPLDQDRLLRQAARHMAKQDSLINDLRLRNNHYNGHMRHSFVAGLIGSAAFVIGTALTVPQQNQTGFSNNPPQSSNNNMVYVGRALQVGGSISMIYGTIMGLTSHMFMNMNRRNLNLERFPIEKK